MYQGETYFHYDVNEDSFLYVSNGGEFLPAAAKFKTSHSFDPERFPYESIAVVENPDFYNGIIDSGEKIKFYMRDSQG